MVFWDNRLPHATAERLSGSDTREVVYTGFLPKVKPNEAYIIDQLAALKHNRPPPAYDEGKLETADRDFHMESLPRAQQKLLGMISE